MFRYFEYRNSLTVLHLALLILLLFVQLNATVAIRTAVRIETNCYTDFGPKRLCPGVGLTSCPAYNVEPVTNTSSLSRANNGRRGVLDTRRRPSRLCFWHFATRMVDNTVDLYAVISEASYSSRMAFLPTTPVFDALVRGVPVRISPSRLVWKN